MAFLRLLSFLTPLQFEGWQNDLDPDDFSLLSILKFRKKKDDFSFNRVVEHTIVSKFVSFVAENADENWRKVASILNKDGELKVSLVRFIIDIH